MMEQTSSADGSGPGSNRRWWIPVFLFLICALNYVERVNLSVAGPLMAKAFHWTPVVLGFAFSSWLWIYTPCLLLSGWTSDHIGSKLTYAIGLAVWTVGAIATGAINSFGQLIGARLVLGVGESVTPPVQSKISREWAPARERGVFVGMFTAGYYAGPALGIPLAALAVRAWGWRTSFYVLGGSTILFLIAWLIFFWIPEKAWWLPSQERAYILAERNAPSGMKLAGVDPSAITRAVVFRHRSTWGLVVTQAAAAYSIYFFLTWLPGYLTIARHMQLGALGLFGSLPYVVAAVAAVLVSLYSDRSLKPEQLSAGGRRIATGVLLLISAFILAVPFVDNIWAIEGLISLSMVGAGTALSLNVALANDLTVNPAVAGFLFGILGTGSNVFAILAPIITGFIVQTTGSFNLAFVLDGVVMIAGALSAFLITRHPIASTVPPPVQPLVAPA